MMPILRSATDRFARIVSLSRITVLFFLDPLYDHLRYLRYSTSPFRRTVERERIEAMLTYYYHKIEKALAMPNPKPVFGLSYIEELLKLLEKLGKEAGGTKTAPFQGAYHALIQYRDWVGPNLQKTKANLLRRIDRLVAAHAGVAEKSKRGGTEQITASELQPPEAWRHLHTLVKSRRSVRNFSSVRVPDEEISAAVSLAQRTPSVCNRQSWRVHVFSSESDKALVLKHQNGNVGFGHLADRVLLLTADMRTFVSSGERNQAFIDGGMFSMSLLYALQARGIVSCPLNLSISFPVDRRLRRAARIPNWETPLMMVAVGYPPERLNVAISARLPTESMLSFRSLEATEPREAQ